MFRFTIPVLVSFVDPRENDQGTNRGGFLTLAAPFPNLLELGFPFCKGTEVETVCRLESGDTADGKSAPRDRMPQMKQESQKV
jgi:hypothetical protein